MFGGMLLPIQQATEISGTNVLTESLGTNCSVVHLPHLRPLWFMMSYNCPAVQLQRDFLPSCLLSHCLVLCILRPVSRVAYLRVSLACSASLARRLLALSLSNAVFHCFPRCKGRRARVIKAMLGRRGTLGSWGMPGLWRS
jgi:hypothetical protein